MKSDTCQSMDAWSNKIEIFRSCGRFSMALGILQEALHLGSTCIGDGNVINTLKKHCNLSTMKVVADILLRSAAFQAALQVYEYLLEETHDGFFNLRMAECLRKLGKLQESLETLQVTTTASADKHYQMGMVFLSLDVQHSLAQVDLTKALFEYHNCKSGKDQPFEVFMKLPSVEMLAVITSANPKTANCLMALGDLYLQRGDHANARAYLKKAFEILAESYGDEAVVPAIGHYLQHSGVAYSDCDDHARAKDYFIQSLSVYKKAFGNDSHHIYIANAVYNIGKTADIACDYSEAEANYRNSLTMYREVFGIDGEPENVARILHRLGDVLVKKGEIYEAEGCFSRSLDILDKLGKLSSCEMASRWKDIGLKWKRVEYGNSLLIKSLTSSLSLYEDLHPDEETMDTKASVLTELAMGHCSNGELDKGKFYARRAFEIVETELDDVEAGIIGGEEEAQVYIRLGKLKILTDEKLEATHHYSKAVDIFETNVQNNKHENLSTIFSLLNQIADLYDVLELDIKRDEAAAKLRKLRGQFDCWGNVTLVEIMRAFEISDKALLLHIQSSENDTSEVFEHALVVYKNLSCCDIAEAIPRVMIDFMDVHQSRVAFKFGELVYTKAIKSYIATHTSFGAFMVSSLRSYFMYCLFHDTTGSADRFIQSVLGQFHSRPTPQLMATWKMLATCWEDIDMNNPRLLFFERALVISLKLNSNESITLDVAAIHESMARILENDGENNQAMKHYRSALRQYVLLSKQQHEGIYSCIMISVLQKLASINEKLGFRADKYCTELLAIRLKNSNWENVTSKEMSKLFMLRFTTLSYDYDFTNKWFEKALEVYKNVEKPNGRSNLVQLLTDMANYYASYKKEMSMQCIADAFELQNAESEATLDDANIELLDSLFRIFTQNHEAEKADAYVPDYLKCCLPQKDDSEEVSDGSEGIEDTVIIAKLRMNYGMKWRKMEMHSFAAEYLFEAVT